MARPQKETIDYFPHMVEHGKTMYIIENKYGLVGYCFWFKLLELLGSSDGHFYDCNNSYELEFLLAKTKTDHETAYGILNTLSELGAIDKDLWEIKIIWSQNFVDGIADAYKRRKIGVPIKPQKESYCTQKPEQEEVIENINDSKSQIEEVNENINPQTKLNKTKLNKTKGNKNIGVDFSNQVNSYTNDPDLIKVIFDFIHHRAILKRPVSSEIQMKAILKELDKHQNKVQVLNQSIANGWQGIFPLKEQDKKQSSSSNVFDEIGKERGYWK